MQLLSNDTLTSRGSQYNLDVMPHTRIDLSGKELKTDEAKLLARFLALPEVLGQIKSLNLRFVLGSTAVARLQHSSSGCF